MFQNQFLVWIAFFCAFLVTINATGLIFGNDAIEPSSDPFYVPEPGFENEKPGAILKTRVVPFSHLSLSLKLFNKEVHQFLYRTTDSLDKPIATVTTLLVPKRGDLTKLVSYQVPEDSGTSNCSPSHSLNGQGYKGSLGPGDAIAIGTLLSKGWYVNVPDHEGPDSYFLAGPNAGHSVLDSIRAVLSTNNLVKLGPNTRVQLWGYSGGAHATGWATQLKQSYAPELNIIGSVFGGTPTNIDINLNFVNNGPDSGFIFAGLAALGRQYAPYGDYLNEMLLPEKKKLFMDASNYCVGELLLKYKNQDVRTYSSSPEDFLNNPIYRKVMDDSLMGAFGPPTFPVLIYHSIEDKTVPYEPAKKMYSDWCASGGTGLTFVTYNSGSHGLTAVVGFNEAIPFIKNRFDGVAYDIKCNSRQSGY